MQLKDTIARKLLWNRSGATLKRLYKRINDECNSVKRWSRSETALKLLLNCSRNVNYQLYKLPDEAQWYHRSKTALNLPGNVTKLIFQSPNQIQFNWTIWKVPRRHPITDFHNIQTPTQIHPENRLKKPQRWQQLRILMSFSGR